MALVPISYNVRSLFVRRSSTLLTIVGIGATVAVLAGVLALQQGFASLFAQSGREDVVVFLQPGAVAEGQSFVPRERAQILLKSTPEIADGADGRPIAASELYIAVRLFKRDGGGETNVPIRGVDAQTVAIRGSDFRMVGGRMFTPGSDEVIVGKSLVERIEHAQIDDVIKLNLTPFKVVGVFECEGPFSSEVWGDVERMCSALKHEEYSRVVAKLRPNSDVKALKERLEADKRTPVKVQTEREYMEAQTQMLSGVLIVLGGFLGLVMGLAAVFTGTNAMLAALAARTHEIGVLVSIGFRPYAVFLAFELEALLLGLLGGVVGCLMVLPLNGVRTGTTNWTSFTEVAFAFRITPSVLVPALVFAVLLGLVGGALPAWHASRLKPTDAMRHE